MFEHDKKSIAAARVLAPASWSVTEWSRHGMKTSWRQAQAYYSVTPRDLTPRCAAARIGIGNRWDWRLLVEPPGDDVGEGGPRGPSWLGNNLGNYANNQRFGILPRPPGRDTIQKERRRAEPKGQKRL
ncbi:phage/plasmid primase, P4 family domain-containing protein [Anopheles sinensis]|uniref:Phage/plasmid primase, P4 family domain-containing protein n=1 Tax=Anopheles sinensis TaxID=74873 RepID=A0A084W8W8_ANOSI|nr:phage/plasmid primase, P4 family domain-containing protein [Anopheles sinensis]